MRNRNWTQQEDSFLKSIVFEGKKNWIQVANNFNNKFFQKLKTPKQIRERYINYCSLPKQILQSSWSTDDMNKLFTLFKKWGSRWTKIAPYIEGKTENMVKNKFNCCLRKLKRKMNSIGKSYSVLKKQLKGKSISRVLDSDKLVNLSSDLKQKGLQIKENILKLANLAQDQVIRDETILKLIYDINQFNLSSRSHKFWKQSSIGFDGQSQLNENEKIMNISIQKNLQASNQIKTERSHPRNEIQSKTLNEQVKGENKIWSSILFDQDMLSLLVEHKKQNGEQALYDIFYFNQSPLHVKKLL